MKLGTVTQTPLFSFFIAASDNKNVSMKLNHDNEGSWKLAQVTPIHRLGKQEQGNKEQGVMIIESAKGSGDLPFIHRPLNINHKPSF